MKRDFNLEITIDDSRSNNVIVKEGKNSIGRLSLVYDSKHRIFEGILIFSEHLDEKNIFKIGQMIQNTFLESDDEMFIEVYFGGFHYGMLCDESPDRWNRMVNG